MAGTLYFVTGTDTGVGKTLFTAGLTAALRRLGRTTIAVKPVETGCVPGPDGALVGGDATLLAAASHHGELPAPAEPGAVGRSPWYRFASPVSPHLAAAREKAHVNADAIAQACSDLLQHLDVVIVEGAGGLLVPLARYVTMADLARRMEARLLVVSRATLGTLNHTLLTLHAAASHGIAVSGVILNHAQEPSPFDQSASSNAAELSKLTDTPVWGPLPYIPVAARAPTDPVPPGMLDELADWVAARVPVKRL